MGLGFDVSADILTSQIRAEERSDSDLLATWALSFATDGTDGEIILTLDNSATGNIEAVNGYMDIKRVTAGEPVPVHVGTIPVVFKETITS
jgi:hypothetical protein